MFIQHETTRIPREIKKQALLETIMHVISSIIFQGLAFFLQLGKEQIIIGHIVIGLLFITVYYTRDILHSLFGLLKDSIYDNSSKISMLFISNTVDNILFTVRNKVWCKNEENNSWELMSPNAILFTCKQYIRLVLKFKTNLPKGIIDFGVLLFSFTGFLAISAIEIEHTAIFISIIVISIVLSVLFSIKRNSYRETYWKEQKEFSQKQDVLLNDIVNIEPLNKAHSDYMVSNFINASKSLLQSDKSIHRKLNLISISNSFFDCLATIAIFGIKVWETGFANVNFEVVLSIISLMTIYSSIVSSACSIIKNVEYLIDSQKNIKSYEDDFKKIITVYNAENNKCNNSAVYVSKVTVPEFAVQYSALSSETPFLLKNPNVLTFKSNDIVLLVGPTGSGKSTLMKMVTNYIRFDSFNLKFETSSNGNGSIKTVMHQTDGRLGSNDILSELTLGKEVDKGKLFSILKGLHLYEELSEKSDDIIGYLKTSKLGNYSTGQKQRLAIARLLYNLTNDIQIIGFDEATNALNDAITLQTLNFVREYCKGKILIIATHQVDIGDTVATQKLEFVPTGTHYEIRQIV